MIINTRALIGMIRPIDAITASFAVFVGLFLALPVGTKPPDPLTLFFISSAAFFTTAYGNTHNDILDVEIDKINSPERALPSGKVTIKEAWGWVIILFILALLSGVMIDIRLHLSFPLSTVWVILNAGLLTLYNWKLKKSGAFGNFLVSYEVYALFLYGDLLINHGFTWLVEGIGLYAFFLHMGKEIIKGIRDIEGDRASGVKTVGVLIGATGAAISASVFIFFAILSSVILIIKTTLLIKIVLIVFDILLIYVIISLLKDHSDKNTMKMKKIIVYLIIMSLIAIGTYRLLETF